MFLIFLNAKKARCESSPLPWYRVDYYHDDDKHSRDTHYTQRQQREEENRNNMMDLSCRQRSRHMAQENQWLRAMDEQQQQEEEALERRAERQRLRGTGPVTATYMRRCEEAGESEEERRRRRRRSCDRRAATPVRFESRPKRLPSPYRRSRREEWM